MSKRILVGLAILTLSTSAAFAAHRTHHTRPVNANATGQPASAYGGWGTSPVLWQGNVSNADRELYYKNLRDSGYNPKNNFNSVGNVQTQ
jgi:hypothetical protein